MINVVQCCSGRVYCAQDWRPLLLGNRITSEGHHALSIGQHSSAWQSLHQHTLSLPSVSQILINQDSLSFL